MHRYSAKLILTFLVILIGAINILLSYSFTHRILHNSIEQSHKIQAQIQMNSTRQIFETKFNSAETALDIICKDEEIQKNLKNFNPETIAAKLACFDSLVIDNESIWLGTEEGNFTSSTRAAMPESYDPREEIWYENGISDPAVYTWSDPFLDYLDQKIVLTVSKKISINGHIAGAAAVKFTVRSLGKAVEDLKVGSRGFMILLNRSGEVLANRENYFIGKLLFDQNPQAYLTPHIPVFRTLIFEGEPYLIDSLEIGVNGMYLAAAVSISEIRAEMKSALTHIFLVEFSAIILFSLMIFFLANQGIQPLILMGRLMRKVDKGDYSVNARFYEYKEVALLSNGFNNMIEGLKTRDAILKKREIRIKNLAYYDNLTGLANRFLLKKQLEEYLTSADPLENQGALMYIDLDRFKIINDTMGHPVGDKVLIEVARKLTHQLRHNQVAARIGGDEFIILLPGIYQPDLIMKIADRLLQSLNTPLKLGSREFDTHASVGIVFYPLHGDTVDDLLKNADLAMYKAKSQGKNNYQIFEDNLQSEIIRKLNIKNGIREALQAEMFTLAYQPQFLTEDSSICGFEALLRTSCPCLKGFPIQEIINLAEETGFIVKIEHQVIKEAARFSRLLRDSGYGKLSISLNVSPLHIMRTDFVATFLNIIREEGADPKMIELEITESVMLNFHEVTIKNLEDLSRNGIRIHMDDFGTGYSSLNYLHELPLDYVKIDRSFISQITTSRKMHRITSLIIDLSSSLNLKTIAEGVENSTQLDFLKEHGCDIIQGFFLSRPLSEKEILELLMN